MSIRVLIVDDSRDDAELTEFALREGGLAVDCRRMHQAEGLEAALDGFLPHLVLCDLNLPGWSGHEALAAVRRRVPTARYVFLTGALKGDEDLSAADAVVLKDDLARLLELARPLASARA
ncbi:MULTISPECIES: response regulator [unclassified Luteimonas]|uniref:response regulator n=1 Tax=unclassified Luteimonas TaxID=2629088 RepID=UPI0018F0FE1B|nr:response regulator [Luteimonas sp. MC1750]MBJ6979960.1 response regulator [Luteimonas sp. MC1895]MBJ6983278.1 response regulator [Luteimonas sp. MC1750]QQO06144.1 response regulator [Luteimonas sp. MC1750]